MSYGDGPLIVIIHGLFGQASNWTSFAKRLSKDFRVLTVDCRNHGGSFHTDEMTYSLMAKDLKRLIGNQKLI